MKTKIFFALLAVVLSVSACQSPASAPTATPTEITQPTLLPTNTVEVLPTETEVPTPTDVPPTPTMPAFSPEAAGYINNIGPAYTFDQLKHPDEIPFEDFAVLSSPAYAEALVYLVNHDGLPVANKATALPYKIVFPSKPDKYRDDSWGYAMQYDDRNYRKEYYDLTKVPYEAIVIRQTQVGDLTFFVMFYSFVNPDGTVGVMASPYFGAKSELYFWMEPFIPDMQMINFVKYGERSKCVSESSIGLYPTSKIQPICDFYMTQETPVVDTILTNWSESGNLVNKVDGTFVVPILRTIMMSLPSK